MTCVASLPFLLDLTPPPGRILNPGFSCHPPPPTFKVEGHAQEWFFNPTAAVATLSVGVNGVTQQKPGLSFRRGCRVESYKLAKDFKQTFSAQRPNLRSMRRIVKIAKATKHDLKSNFNMISDNTPIRTSDVGMRKRPNPMCEGGVRDTWAWSGFVKLYVTALEDRNVKH